MSEDPRCCGSGTCIIDAEGRCWCGQQWNGTAMGHPPRHTEPQTEPQTELQDPPDAGQAGVP